MPPALSDYDSESDLDFDAPFLESVKTTKASPIDPVDRPAGDSVVTSRRQITPRQNSVTPASSAARKSRLLSGLDLSNILSLSEEDGTGTDNAAPKDTPPTSSVPTSSYQTRRQRQSHRKNHPMDEFMHPQRAAQRRAHYEDVPDSDETVPPSDPEDNGSESEDVYRRDAKRIRLSDHSSVRRSLRGTNQNVNYRMDVHPQDQELASMEDEVVLASTETASIEESGAVGAILESARDQAQYLVEQIELVDSEDEVESVLHQEQGTNVEPLITTSGPYAGLIRYPLGELKDGVLSGSAHRINIDTPRRNSGSRSSRRSSRRSSGVTSSFHVFEDPRDNVPSMTQTYDFDDGDKENDPTVLDRLQELSVQHAIPDFQDNVGETIFHDPLFNGHQAEDEDTVGLLPFDHVRRIHSDQDSIIGRISPPLG